MDSSYAVPPTEYSYRAAPRRTAWLRRALWADVLVSILFFVVSVAGAFVPAVAKAAGPGFLAWQVFFAISAILFLVWIHRVAANVTAFGADVTFDPPWAVGWLLIPVVSLWMAFVVIEELWRASLDSRTWHAQRAPWLVVYWWAAWVIAGAGATLLYFSGGGLVAKIVYFAGHIAYAFLSIAIVDGIHDLQRSQAAQHGIA